MKRGIKKIKQEVGDLGKDENGWRVALYGFGDRQKYASNWTLRAAAAMAGIYGNSSVDGALCRIPAREQLNLSGHGC